MRTSWTPSDDVDGLCVFDESGEVCDFAVLAVAVDLPELHVLSAAVSTTAMSSTHPNVVVSTACS